MESNGRDTGRYPLRNYHFHRPVILSCDCAFEHGGGDRRTDHLDAALRCGRGQNGAGCHLSGRRHGGRGGWYRVFWHHCFSYSLWAMALNNLGWLVIVLLLNHRMSGIVVKMNEKLNPKWVKLLMGGATLGLFAYLLTNQLVGKTSIKWAAAILSGVIMLVLTTAFKKHQRIQELALGISMLGGMFLTQAIMG